MITAQFKGLFCLKFLNCGRQEGDEGLGKKISFHLPHLIPSYFLSCLPQVGEERWWWGGGSPREEAQGPPGEVNEQREWGAQQPDGQSGHDQQSQVTHLSIYICIYWHVETDRQNVTSSVHDSTQFLVQLKRSSRNDSLSYPAVPFNGVIANTYQ